MFDLLPSGIIGLLSGEPLVFTFLLLLEFLPLFFLLRVNLLLLFFVFAVLLGISRVWRSRTLGRRKLIRMDGSGARRVVACAFSTCIPTRRIFSRRTMNGTTFSGGDDPTIIECASFGSGGNRRLAVIFRRA